jgi:hypothetical protein
VNCGTDPQQSVMTEPGKIPQAFIEDVKRLLQQSSLEETAQEEFRPFRNSDTRGSYRHLAGLCRSPVHPAISGKGNPQANHGGASSPQPGIASWVYPAPLPVARPTETSLK